MVQIRKSQCLFNREFPKFFKTHQNFSLGEILRPLGAKNLSASLSVVGCIDVAGVSFGASHSHSLKVLVKVIPLDCVGLPHVLDLSVHLVNFLDFFTSGTFLLYGWVAQGPLVSAPVPWIWVLGLGIGDRA